MLFFGVSEASDAGLVVLTKEPLHVYQRLAYQACAPLNVLSRITEAIKLGFVSLHVIFHLCPAFDLSLQHCFNRNQHTLYAVHAFQGVDASIWVFAIRRSTQHSVPSIWLLWRYIFDAGPLPFTHFLPRAFFEGISKLSIILGRERFELRVKRVHNFGRYRPCDALDHFLWITAVSWVDTILTRRGRFYPRPLYTWSGSSGRIRKSCN